ncbi:MAG TPA: alpha/beta hydrolase [Pseudolabrys sp.]
MRSSLISYAVVAFSLSVAGVWAPVHAATVRNIVIVHGAFADGSGWKKVSELLAAKGYQVSIVQQPLNSLQDDIAATRRVLALQDGPTLLVGHSYGGMVITGAGNDSKVNGLVYVAAFQPADGESLISLAERMPVVDAPPGTIKATADDYLYLDPTAFAAAFSADLPKAESDFLARSQVFAAKAAFTAPSSAPAWKSKPSWSIVATLDRSINPALEREMAMRAGSKIREIKASHAVYVSQPAKVAQVIVEAAKEVSK